MKRVNLIWSILVSTVFFVLTVIILAFFGYEVRRDTQFEIDCQAAGGVYFVSKSNEEYCANSDFVFNPSGG